MQHCLCVSLLVFALVTSAGASDRFGPRDFGDEPPRTAIVAAYAPEIRAIDAALGAHPEAEITEELSYRGVRYQLGHYRGEPIVIFTTGVSVSNAAMTVQMALDYFPISRVVMMGIAGGVNPVYVPGDIAVPERWYFHDESVYANPDPEAPGEYILADYYEATLERHLARLEDDPHAPRYENFGFIHPDEVAVVKDGWDRPREMPYFAATPSLIAAARRVVDRLGEIRMPSGRPITVTVGGNGVTGSVFLDHAAYREWTREVFAAEVTEMESAAVGQVCFVNEVDWVIVRAVSDLAGGQAGKNEENVYDAIASGTGAKLLLALLDEIVEATAGVD
ncbi:MAG: purine phosphorylase [Opitutales bacterium]